MYKYFFPASVDVKQKTALWVAQLAERLTVVHNTYFVEFSKSGVRFTSWRSTGYALIFFTISFPLVAGRSYLQHNEQ